VKPKHNKPTETTSDFKHRIAVIMRANLGLGDYSLVGAAHADQCVLRRPRKRALLSNNIPAPMLGVMGKTKRRQQRRPKTK